MFKGVFGLNDEGAQDVDVNGFKKPHYPTPTSNTINDRIDQAVQRHMVSRQASKTTVSNRYASLSEPISLDCSSVLSNSHFPFLLNPSQSIAISAAEGRRSGWRRAPGQAKPSEPVSDGLARHSVSGTSKHAAVGQPHAIFVDPYCMSKGDLDTISENANVDCSGTLFM